MENDLKAAIAFERKVARVIESHRKGLMDPTAELDTNELYEAVKGDGHVRGGILTVVHIRKVDARVKKKLLDEKRIAGLMEAARLDPSLDDADAEDDNEMFTSAQLSRASGDGLKEASVRQHAYFWIEAVNTNGRRMTVGGDTWHVAIRGPSQAHARVTDNNDGTYLVIWKPHCSGAYSVAISLGGESLGKSPFLVRVGTALPCAANCEVKGSALHSAVSRATQAFDIRFRDRMGQVATAVDLDVFVEPVPMRSPRNRELPLSEEEKREQEEKAAL